MRKKIVAVAALAVAAVVGVGLKIFLREKKFTSV